MDSARKGELLFEVTEESEGGYSAECLTESIVTQGDTWDELRANGKAATAAYFYDAPKPKFVHLRLIRSEIVSMESVEFTSAGLVRFLFALKRGNLS